MPRTLTLTRFKDVDLNDPFFDSLKAGYIEFPQWFAGKAGEPLYVVTDGASVSGMIYLKEEQGPVTDVTPALPNRRWLKVGTLKIVGQGTRRASGSLRKSSTQRWRPAPRASTSPYSTSMRA